MTWTPLEGLDRPHRRRNPLTGEWVLVAPQRMHRPWGGAVSAPPKEQKPAYDPECYLCPGNRRAGGAAVNPDYDGTFVFTNDFPSLVPDTPATDHSAHPLLQAEGEAGTSRVICFSPRHDLRVATMDDTGRRAVVDLWADQAADLAGDCRWVQIFENSGAMMGASSPHPHGQIWAGSARPSEIEREDRHQLDHVAAHGAPLLVQYADLESADGSRTVAATDHWLVVVPFWAKWPYETLVLPRRHVLRLPDLDGPERNSLATALGRLLGAYDRLFARPFPYSMGWHPAPNDPGDLGHWQLHAHFYPPLLRDDVRKHMVGYEMLAEAQRDLTPEAAAERLQA